MPNPLHTHLKCMYVFIYVLYLSIFILQQKKSFEYFHSAGGPPKKGPPTHTCSHTRMPYPICTYGHPMAE